MSKKIAVFEIPFDADIMFSEQAIKDEFGGDWLKAMQWLFEEEGPGLFIDEPAKLTAIVTPKKDGK